MIWLAPDLILAHQVARFTGHINTINCMLVVDDSKEVGESFKTTYLFTGGYDHLARCFNAETGEILATYKGHASFIFTLKVGHHIGERLIETMPHFPPYP